MDRYLEEILGQPDAFRRAALALRAQAATVDVVAAQVGGGASALGGALLLAGMGSSFDACLSASAVLGSAGVVATTVEASELLHVRRPVLSAATLLVLVSQSGESPEVIGLAEAARTVAGPRPFVLAITNGLRTPLAGRVDATLDTAAGLEICPSSMTFAAALVALAAVAGILLAAGGPERRDVAVIIDDVAAAARAAAEASAQLLDDPLSLTARLGSWLGGRSSLVMLGRGVGLAAAEMGALTVQEVAGLPALALPTAEFRHGPLEMIGPDVAVVLFSLERAAVEMDRAFAAELAATGAAVMIVGPSAEPPDRVAGLAVGGPGGILAPGIALVPVQLLARALAAARGREPGAFTRAAKVTVRE